MNVLFLTIGRLKDINAPGIYTDLLRFFHQEGHEVYVACSREKKHNLPTEYKNENGFHFLRVKIGNITQCSTIEKGISTVRVQGQYIRAIQKHLRDVRFNLVIYTTPPITLLKAVQYVKNRDGAKTYLLLKDIFPQNAVDIGLMPKEGIRGALYRHFRRQEKKLYAVSDRIGCMSPANAAYLIRHNPEVDPNKTEVCPNTTDPIDRSCTAEERETIRKRYGIPPDKQVFVYGGNLGKPQDIPFIIECLQACRDIDQAFFLIVGNGTEYGKLERFIQDRKPGHVKLMPELPKTDYDQMIGSCDAGLIFLDHRFTIPNFPSRLLSYMQAKLPTLACTDPNTDIGDIVEEGGFGWKCESNDAGAFRDLIRKICATEHSDMGEKAFDYLNKHYTSQLAYTTIIRAINEKGNI